MRWNALSEASTGDDFNFVAGLQKVESRWLLNLGKVTSQPSEDSTRWWNRIGMTRISFVYVRCQICKMLHQVPPIFSAVTQGWFLLKPPPDADRNCYEGALERVDGRIRDQRWIKKSSAAAMTAGKSSRNIVEWILRLSNFSTCGPSATPCGGQFEQSGRQEDVWR